MSTTIDPAPSDATEGYRREDRRYVPPTAADRRANAAIAWLVRRGVGVWGARILAVPGRRSGHLRETVVNVLEHDGRRYLVAPRGEAQWVRNLRAAGAGTLRVGRRRSTFRAVELEDAGKPAILARYLERWGFEAGRFFEVDDRTDLEQLAAIAPHHPVFELVGVEPVSRR